MALTNILIAVSIGVGLWMVEGIGKRIRRRYKNDE
jgi:hypothetical protein